MPTALCPVLWPTVSKLPLATLLFGSLPTVSRALSQYAAPLTSPGLQLSLHNTRTFTVVAGAASGPIVAGIHVLADELALSGYTS